MSLFNTLREAGRRDLINVTLYLENGNTIDAGAYPGSHLRNLNDFILELDIAAKGENIKKIDIDGFIVSFE
jgi:hypothetical protein